MPENNNIAVGQKNVGNNDFEYGIVYKSYLGYTLDQLKRENDYEYTILDPEGDVVDTFYNKQSALNMSRIDFFKSKIYKKFTNLSLKHEEKNYAAKYGDEDAEYDDYSSSNYFNRSYSYNPVYKTSKEEAIKKYCNSNTLCFHKTDPTTTMLDQIYSGKGWDVVNDAYEMSSDTIAELIDRHERIVMLGHGTSGGLIGFINPSHAHNLEPKKLFALWCNADAYCRQYLPNKKGFFACGNMPSDDGEALCVGYHVSHKYMDDNITYWCKLCGDVVEQCLEGDADAGCQYIRDKYWERYHKGTADQVGITKYNYVRTKVAGQDNLPEPEGEEIEGPKETEEERRAKERASRPVTNFLDYTRGSNSWSRDDHYIPAPSQHNYEWLDSNAIENGSTLFETSTGAECTVYRTKSNSFECVLSDSNGVALHKVTFGVLAKNGQNVYDRFKKDIPEDQLGQLIIPVEVKEVPTKNKNNNVLFTTDQGYSVEERKDSNGYVYTLKKGNSVVHNGHNPTKLNASEVYQDFDNILDIGKIVKD